MTSSTPTATLDSALLAPTASIDSWRSAFGRAWRIYLPVRLVLSLCGALTMLFTQGMPAERSLRAWLSWLLLEPWNRMDVPWYLKIADGGYAIADGRASFHPLLPLLTRLLGTLLGGNTLLAGLLVANLACLGFLAALFRYVALDHGELVAGEALRWALYLPVGFVLLIPYTEPLLLCFTLLALWAARHERWFAAGAWACLAALTKQPGAALVAPLLWEAAARYRWGLLSWRGLRVVACLGLGPLGYLGFSFYRATMLGEVGGATVGELLRSLLISPQLSTGWGTRFGWPWEWLVCGHHAAKIYPKLDDRPCAERGWPGRGGGRAAAGAGRGDRLQPHPDCADDHADHRGAAVPEPAATGLSALPDFHAACALEPAPQAAPRCAPR